VRSPVLSDTGPFPREARVRQRWEYRKIHREGARVHTPSFTIVARPTLADAGARMGCAVSRKVGNAVVRNRIRRLLKEMFRRLRSDLPDVDYVFIAKPEARALVVGGLGALVDELLGPIEVAGRRAFAPRRPRPRGKRKK
jgi:ribonuclease P protein component